ncbi:LysR substrate-binding domain-containing protein [Streptomyces sp. SP17BM10]|uniref:LysR substrate-binding domain-containing protein n=1 Tax=Streptomyces sp. SP17BM10 TaxID=3002530 RepID=UPI002E793C2D|nr:LysR substrate-binding domain-containing protein [Streptomyces sp. SP17BM10]MEE1788653.1 LysR substrate-binding domain-containing protein [Streptomyces sp. SP17BM10]
MARPGMALSTQSSSSTPDLVGRVVDGRLDLVLTGVCGHQKVMGDERLEWREIAVDPVFAVLSEDHPLARETELMLSQL